MTPTVPAPAWSCRPRLVLDTNVVLDWLVFKDPSCAALGAALVSGRVSWVASTAMRDELAHVLARGACHAWAPDLPGLWSAWDRSANIVEPQPWPQPGSPRCTDPDDQKFIDLGLQVGASALLSWDRAVLRCARRARVLGLNILTPRAWALSWPD